MGKLPKCNCNQPYFNMFWSIEVDPTQTDDFSRQKVKKVFEGIRAKGKIFVAKEVSKTGYHHIHAVCKWAKVRKWEPIKKKLVKELTFTKANGRAISVRAFHPRLGGTEDYAEMVSYLTESKYKSKMTDDNAIEFYVEDYCQCGFLGLIATCICNPENECSCPPECHQCGQLRWCRCGARRCGCGTSCSIIDKKV